MPTGCRHQSGKDHGKQQIASELSISLRTGKFHVSSLLLKLNASNRTEAILRGLITSPSHRS
jgi:DNA-binding NarL/FixJ family response regulator